MRILVDMNLSPQWCDFLRRFGIEGMHWSSVGNPAATDAEIMAWAKLNACVVLTHDLDFGTILAATHADSPSVIQLRAQDVLPEAFGLTVVQAIRGQCEALESGALLVVDTARARIRMLPLR